MAKGRAITFEEAHQAVKNLVKDFEKSESFYLSKDYSEADVRKDFIDKFFTALGWDVNHNYDKNPYKQEVKIETTVEVAAAQKRADYAFYLKPDFSNPVFFVEAKKPQKKLLNRDFYFQTIRYGWHKQTPIAVLTDFEEFHIIDCRYSPDIETALSRKIKQFHYKDYENAEKFAEIYYLFSREAVKENSINDFAETLPKPKGKSTQKALFGYGLLHAIDETFLKDIEDFRLRIARAMFLTNKNISAALLTEATQSVIDRLVFIRFLEDKLIEPVHYVSNFGSKQSAWFDFIMVSKLFNKKYNGIIFKPKVIDAQDFIPPDDEEFQSVCSDICHINSRFLFNEIPIHIMGTIYERFLGKQIYIENGRVKLDETPAARRAGGVYYTPQFVVDYIVDKTVGKAIKGKSPEEIKKLSFIDIACGSGSFLIAVFDKLLRYLHNWYQEHPKKAKMDGCINKEELWVLSIRQKQEILRNNIFGIDIDYNAVEVTQLSLALKMLDDETQATAKDMVDIDHSAILPDLTNNIKCGNSLIGYNQMFSDIDFETLNPLDFHQAFLTVMSRGGFDCVVGNPPYIQLQKDAGRLGNALKKENYETYERTGDIYTIFIEKALGIINQLGRIGFITSNKWMRAGYGKKLRKFLAEKSKPEILIDFAGFKVFKDATVDTNILIAAKGVAGANIPACSVKSDFNLVQGLDGYVRNNLDAIYSPSEDSWIISNKIERSIKKKIERIGTPLKDWDVNIYYGIKTGYNEAFIIDGKKRAELIAADPKSEEIIKPILRGRDIKRYHAEFADLWLIDTHNGYKRTIKKEKIFSEEENRETNTPTGYAVHPSVDANRGSEQEKFPSHRGVPRSGGVFNNYKQLPYNPKLKSRAKALRKAGILSEVLFWNKVKNKQFLGLDFHRQKIIGNYIVDFYCSALNLVVEIDGISHNFKDKYDVVRDEYLKSLGLDIVRFKDIEIKKNLDEVLDGFYKYCSEKMDEGEKNDSDGKGSEKANTPSGYAVHPSEEGNKNDVVIVPPVDVNNYPAIKNHLDRYYDKLKKRQDKGYTPYNLRNCAYHQEFEKEKIVYNDITQKLSFSFVPEGFYFNNTAYFIAYSKYNSYFISILNSNLINWYFKNISQQLGKNAVRMFSIYVEQIPIPKIDKEAQKPFEEAAERIIDAYEKLQGEKSSAKRQLYQNLIDSNSAKIDRMVYELYGLTEKEIRYIEGRV